MVDNNDNCNKKVKIRDVDTEENVLDCAEETQSNESANQTHEKNEKQWKSKINNKNGDICSNDEVEYNDTGNEQYENKEGDNNNTNESKDANNKNIGNEQYNNKEDDSNNTNELKDANNNDTSNEQYNNKEDDSNNTNELKDANNNDTEYIQRDIKKGECKKFNIKNDNTILHNTIKNKYTNKKSYNMHEQQKNKLVHTLNDYTISEPLIDQESTATLNKSFLSESDNPLKYKECWICLSSDPNHFLCPCQCKGSTKYVHKECFLDFIQSKKIENLKCTFCKTGYILKSKYDSFLMVFEKIRKINFYACQFIFIVYAMILVYCILFLYGIAVVILFLGYDDLIRYISAYDSTHFFIHSYINIVRLAINVPIIPICILLSTHKKFSYFFHILPSIMLFDSFDLKYFPIYFSPLLLFLYNKAISYIEKKYGKKNGEASILVNNHSFEVKIIINALLAPFFGILVGEIFFYGGKKKSLRSFYGCVCYTLVKDFFSIYYLVLARKRIRTLEIEEYQ